MSKIHGNDDRFVNENRVWLMINVAMTQGFVRLIFRNKT